MIINNNSYYYDLLEIEIEKIDHTNKIIELRIYAAKIMCSI